MSHEDEDNARRIVAKVLKEYGHLASPEVLEAMAEVLEGLLVGHPDGARLLAHLRTATTLDESGAVGRDEQTARVHATPHKKTGA